jgi:hypothetical protein
LYRLPLRAFLVHRLAHYHHYQVISIWQRDLPSAAETQRFPVHSHLSSSPFCISQALEEIQPSSFIHLALNNIRDTENLKSKTMVGAIKVSLNCPMRGQIHDPPLI